jgi:hypothetical protein
LKEVIDELKNPCLMWQSISVYLNSSMQEFKSISSSREQFDSKLTVECYMRIRLDAISVAARPSQRILTQSNNTSTRLRIEASFAQYTPRPRPKPNGPDAIDPPS